MVSTPRRKRNDLDLDLGKAYEHLLDSYSMGFFPSLFMGLLKTICILLETHLNLAKL